MPNHWFNQETFKPPEDELVLCVKVDKKGNRSMCFGRWFYPNETWPDGHWVTGEPFNFTAWYPGEPSRNDTDGTPEFYMMLWKVGDEWSWNDQRNDVITNTGFTYFIGKTGYICEYEE